MGRGRKALDDLLEVLTDVDLIGDDDLGDAALRILGERPALVVRLDEDARRALWPSNMLDRLVMRLDGASPGPIAVALAGTHRDGRIRERAVRALADRPSPGLMPFLAVRTGDWVTPVRDRARAALALLLADDPAAYLPPALPTILLTEPRLRGGFAYGQALAALITAPERVREALTMSGGRRQRRLVFDVSLAHGGMRTDALVAVAESDDDIRIRVRATEAACRDAVWTRRAPVLERLARNRRAEVRVIALTGLVRVGETATVAACLDDAAPLARALARDTALRLGTDVLGHYRDAVTAASPPTGAVAGLAETGTGVDAVLLRPLLAHPTSAVRAAALRALNLLDAVDVEETIPLLRDPSPAVVREATTALRLFHRRLPSGLARDLLADPRAEVRRAGYRLLRDRSTAEQLHAALTLAVDTHPGLVRRSHADLTRLARAAAPPPRARHLPPELHVTAAEHARLTELVHRAALAEETTDLLLAWLAATTPSGA